MGAWLLVIRYVYIGRRRERSFVLTARVESSQPSLLSSQVRPKCPNTEKRIIPGPKDESIPDGVLCHFRRYGHGWDDLTQLFKPVRLQFAACNYSSDGGSMKSSSQPPAEKKSESPQKPKTAGAEAVDKVSVKYMAEQLFQYTPTSFFDIDLQMANMRLPQPSSIKPKPL